MVPPCQLFALNDSTFRIGFLAAVWHRQIFACHNMKAQVARRMSNWQSILVVVAAVVVAEVVVLMPVADNCPLNVPPNY